MSALGKYFPTVEASCMGDEVYENIQWTGGDPLPTADELNKASLTEHKEMKITELSNACAQQIISGFESAALGAPHLYDSEAVDQLNIVGSFSATTPDATSPEGSQTYHAVRPIIDGIPQMKEYKLHDNIQMKKVLLDGVAFKLVKLSRFNDLRNEILANEERTIAEINDITWKTGIPGVVN